MIISIKHITVSFLFLFSTIINSQELFYSLNPNINADEIVATIDTIEITAREFFYNYEYGPSFAKRKSNSKQLHLDFLINEKLISLEGSKYNVLNKEENKSILYDISSDIATEEFFKDSILSKVKYSDSEIDKTVMQKRIYIDLKWIYNKNKSSIDKLYYNIINNNNFNKIFNDQISDSIKIDQRSMSTSLHMINKKNPVLFSLIDSLVIGSTTEPIKKEDGWYIFRIDNISNNIIITEAEKNKLRKESVESLTKAKMDSISDQFVNSILVDNNPIIKRNVFNIASSYIGQYRLPKDLYDSWKLKTKMDKSLTDLGLSKNNKYNSLVLVELKNGNILLEQFINWFRNRELYIKLPKSNIIDYSKSLEKLIWLMVRDDILTKIAENLGYTKRKWVQEQSRWWKEKIAYSSYVNEMKSTISISNDEVNTKSKEMSKEFTQFLFGKITQLKKKSKVKINSELLDNINVSTQNNKKAISIYTIKKGGLIPRLPYPTIDNEWSNWL